MEILYGLQPIFKKLGRSFQQAAQPKWCRSEPEVAWFFYGHRLQLYRAARPHLGYDILIKWMKRKPGSGFVFTSNVDEAWLKAGLPPKRLCEVHGSINRLQCIDGESCGGHPSKAERIWRADDVVLSIDEKEGLCSDASIPRCRYCKQLARPNVVMFDDDTVVTDIINEQYFEMEKALVKARREALRICVIDIGSGTAIPTCRNQAERVARDFGADFVRLNPREPEFDNLPSKDNYVSLPLGAADGLSRIDVLLEAKLAVR